MFGNDYAVGGPADLKVTPVAGNRQVTVAAGTAFGRGVTTVLSTPETQSIAAPTNGQWHLLVLRRIWATKTTSLQVIAHTTTTTTPPTAPPLTYPGGLLSSPGVQDDQPIAWLWVNSGSTAVVVVPLNKQRRAQQLSGSSADRDAYYGAPTDVAAQVGLQLTDARWFNTDTLKGYEEKYYGPGSTTNPGGVTSAPGWYPAPGAILRADYLVTGNPRPNSTTSVVQSGWSTKRDRFGWRGASGASAYTITPTVPGIYRGSCIPSFGNGSGGRIVTLQRSVVTVFTDIMGQMVYSPYGVGNGRNSFGGTLDMNGSTDGIQLSAYQDSGASMNMDAILSFEYVAPITFG